MRITFATIDDFCEELDREAERNRVWRNEVFTRIDQAPEQDLEISFLVALWATVAIRGDDGDYILEFGAECGSDEPRAKTFDGTKRAEEWLTRIKGLAEKYGLLVRKGKLEVL